MKRAALLAIVLLARVATADGHHVLVLRSDGSADAATRGKVDVQVLKLAKSIAGANVESGEIAFADAALAAGCATATAPSCKDDVLATLGVDEVIATTVDASGGEIRVDVRRIVKGSSTHASTTVPAGQPPDQKLNAEVGPLFGVAAMPSLSEPTPYPKDTATPAPAPASPPTPAAAASAATTASTSSSSVTAAPDNQITQTPDDHSGSRHLEIAGMAAGGGLVLIGAIFWAEASSTQNDINSAPTKTAKDFQNLQSLESDGDTYATIGNVAFIGGLAVGAVAGYFYWRDQRDHHAQQAHLAPTVLPHGGGIALTFGAP